MIHEIIIMIASYHLLIYSNATYYDLQFIGGYSLQFLLLVLSVFNVSKIFVEAIEDYRRKSLLQKKKDAIQKHYDGFMDQKAINSPLDGIQYKKILKQKEEAKKKLLAKSEELSAISEKEGSDS